MMMRVTLTPKWPAGWLYLWPANHWPGWLAVLADCLSARLSVRLSVLPFVCLSARLEGSLAGVLADKTTDQGCFIRLLSACLLA